MDKAEPLRVRVHVSEPFDFERENDSADLYGTTRDSEDSEADEWVIELEGRFCFNEVDYDAVLVAPRYVGDHLSRVFDSFLGEPVRIAHRTAEGWHFAMAGIISLAPPPPEESGTDDDTGSNEDPK
jgi:hypothetical protein